MSDELEVWDEAECDGYLLAEIRIVENACELRNLNQELLKELIESQKITTQEVQPSGRVITSDSETVKKLIETYGDRMFEAQGNRFDRIQRDQ